jgi:O-antigen ligase
MLQVATTAQSLVARGLAAAAMPAVVLAIFFTLSRTGMAAAAVAIVVFLSLSSDRIPKSLTLALVAAGAGILIFAAASRHSLQHGLVDSTARDQGDVVLLMTLLVCVVVGMAQVWFSVLQSRVDRPSWSVFSRQRASRLTIAGALVLVVAAIAFDLPGRASGAWGDFKHNEETPVAGVGRLGSFDGQSRYQFWSAAVEQNKAHPWIGTGSGTFRFWWARTADTRDVVTDTHSLYLQTLGELGIIGLLLLAAFLSVPLVVGTRAALRARHRERDRLAATVAGCVAFSATAAFDWTWQQPVLPIAFLMLSAALVSAGARRASRPGIRLPLRIGFLVVAIATLAAIGGPLASTAFLRDSQEEAKAGNLPDALDAAGRAQAAEPDWATPRLQRALLLEEMGAFTAAGNAARAATERESTNWQTWLVLSRIEAERGRATPALQAYRKAKSLNALSALFAP